MANYEVKSLDKADETREFENGKVDVVRLGDHSIGRTTLQPGWRWSDAVKPVVNTEWCEVPHVGFCIAGQINVRMSDGSEFQVRAGDAYTLASGHDAWVDGSEPFQGVEFESLADYAKPS
jgi:hypothetical protein